MKVSIEGNQTGADDGASIMVVMLQIKIRMIMMMMTKIKIKMMLMNTKIPSVMEVAPHYKLLTLLTLLTQLTWPGLLTWFTLKC